MKNWTRFVENSARNVVCWSSTAALLYLTVTAFTSTWSSPNSYTEHLDPYSDPVVWGTAITLFAVCLMGSGVSRWLSDEATAEKRLRIGCAAVCIWIFMLAVLWGLQGDFVPAYDMGQVWNAALALLEGRTEFVNESFFEWYPFQVGTAYYFMLVFRLFGAPGILPIVLTNAAWLSLCVWCGYWMTGAYCRDPRARGVYLILAALCIQPVLYSPICYGELPSFGCCWLALVCAVKFSRGGGWRWLLLLAGAAMLGVVVRSTSMITVLAIVLVFAVEFFCLRDRRTSLRNGAALLMVLVIFAAGVKIGDVLSRYMEFRYGVELKDGMPKSSWLVMGVKESGLGPGWFGGWRNWVYEASHGDMELADVKSKIELKNQFRMFAEDPAYAAEFFGNKMASQWSDPTFQCLANYYKEESAKSGLVTALYEGELHQTAIAVMDRYQSVVYLAALAGALALYRKKDEGIACTLPLVVFLGGFLFYFFWEAKGRYCLPFFMMLLPVAAEGVLWLHGLLVRGWDRLNKKWKKTS